jgi:L-seryl-tRNA(Ser) seleniumtransferase
MADLRGLPKVDVLASHPALADFLEPIRIAAARETIAELRQSLISGSGADLENAPRLAVAKAHAMSRTSIRNVINATGVILHTGLGRARLAKEALEAIEEAAKGYAAVEFDLGDGQRGDRQDHVRHLLCQLTGAADALVVNNCAAALVLTLAAICKGKGVLLSRGQMVEIGGSFRVPEIIKESGCNLVEIGCTNKTHASDYALESDNLGAILRCHPSNFRIIGFTSSPSIEELKPIAIRQNLLLIDDLGSGCTFDTTQYGLPKEPTMQESLRAGADVVLSSGDKLLGGPQAGLILGSKEALSKIKSHPLARAFRIDKLTLAALEATLRLWLQNRASEIPTIAALQKPLEEIRAHCDKIAAVWQDAVVEEGLTEVGSGSAPGVGIPTVRVGLRSQSAQALAQQLRNLPTPIVGRTERDLVWLDPRTMADDEVEECCRQLEGIRG